MGLISALEAWRYRRARGLALAGLVSLAALLAACGGAGGSPLGSSSASPTLSCVSVTYAHDVDVITAQLTCHVTGAAASDTSFTLHYTVTNDSGQTRPFTATCVGTLTNGAGSCAQSYSAPVPIPLTPAAVSGATEPGHAALGPVTPTQRDATPQPGQHL